MFENNLINECSSLALAHMQVKVDENASEQDEQVTYLYKSASYIVLVIDAANSIQSL